MAIVADIAKAICDLTPDQIRQRQAELRDEQRALQLLLRSAVAREQARNRRGREAAGNPLES